MRNTGIISEGVVSDVLKKTESWVGPVYAWRHTPSTKVKKEKPSELQQDAEYEDVEGTLEGLLEMIPETAKEALKS